MKKEVIWCFITIANLTLVWLFADFSWMYSLSSGTGLGMKISLTVLLLSSMILISLKERISTKLIMYYLTLSLWITGFFWFSGSWAFQDLGIAFGGNLAKLITAILLHFCIWHISYVKKNKEGKIVWVIKKLPKQAIAVSIILLYYGVIFLMYIYGSISLSFVAMLAVLFGIFSAILTKSITKLLCSKENS